MAAPVQPYASVYLSQTGLIISEETLAVRQFYLDAGLAAKALGRIPDDHLGGELDFLYFVTISAIESHRRGDVDAETIWLAKRKAFVRTHFARWVPELAAILERTADQAFLRSAPALLRAVVGELET